MWNRRAHARHTHSSVTVVRAVTVRIGKSEFNLDSMSCGMLGIAADQVCGRVK